MKLLYVLVLVGFVLLASATPERVTPRPGGHNKHMSSASAAPIMSAVRPKQIPSASASPIMSAVRPKQIPSASALPIMSGIRPKNPVGSVMPPIVVPPVGSGKMPLPTLLELAQRLQLNSFLAALRASDPALMQILSGSGPFTIFAPSDAAFQKFGQRNLNELLGDPMRLRQFLLYHIVTGRVNVESLTNGQRLTTLEGEQLTVRIANNNIYINDALITSRDNLASNGIIHIIDTVLIPPSFGSFFGSSGSGSAAPGVLIPRLLEDLGLNTFYSLLTQEVLTILNGTGPYTVFAPSEAAFNRISRQTLQAIASDPVRLRQILLYHIVPGLYPTNLLTNGLLLATLEGQDLRITVSSTGIIRVNEAAIVSPNHYASNGVVQIIDTLLMPPTGSGLPTVIGLAQELGLTSFLSALITADTGLYQSLNANGPYTLFVPTNEAFTRFMATQGSSVTSMLSDPILLHQIMLYHVLYGTFPESSFVQGTMPTLDDHQRITLNLTAAGWRVNNALITSPDHMASNGIIHIIDTLLIPPDLLGSGSPSMSGSGSPVLVPLLTLARQLNLNKFLALTALADPAIRELLNTTGPFTLFIPDDSAITLIGSGLLADRARLNELLLYWIVPGLYRSTSLTNGESLLTAEGEPLTIRTMNGKIYVNNNALITSPDHLASNGIIHILDNTIYPPSFTASGSSSSGSGLLRLPELLRTLNLTTFEDALRLTGIEVILEGPGPYTVFAPTNEAIASLPASALSFLNANLDIYRTVLLYNMVPGRFTSDMLTDGERIYTLQGSPVIITRPATTTDILVNNARILTRDQLASNGIVQTTDRLIVPAPLTSVIGLPPV